MKKFRKVMSLVLALALVFGLSATAFAANTNSSEDEKFTITISNAHVGEIYSAYKIFDVTYDDSGNYSYTIDSNSQMYSWLKDATGIFTLTQVGETSTYVVAVKDGVTEEQILNAIETGGIEKSMTADVTAEAESTTLVLDVTKCGPGYYYVTTTTGSVVSITTTDPNANIIDKNGSWELDKVIVNGLDEDSTLHEDAEAMGDDVVFQVTANVPLYTNEEPDNVKDTYEGQIVAASSEGYLVTDYKFEDSMSEGLEIRGLALGIDYTIDSDGKYWATASLIDTWVTIDGTPISQVAYNVKLQLIPDDKSDENGQVQFNGFVLTYDTLPYGYYVFDSTTGEYVVASETTGTYGLPYDSNDDQLKDSLLTADSTVTFETATDLVAAVGTNYPANATIEIDYTAHVTDEATYENTNDITMTWDGTTYRNPTPLNPLYTGSDDKKDHVYVLDIDILKVDGNKVDEVTGEYTSPLAGAEFKLEGTNLKDVVTSQSVSYTPLSDEEYPNVEEGTVLYFLLKSGEHTTVSPYDLEDGDPALDDYVVNPYWGIDSSGNQTGNGDIYEVGNYKYVAYTKAVTDEYGLEESGDDGYVTGTTDSDGKLSFNGLTVGDWTLTEITAPDGYNLLAEPITFKISVKWDETTGEPTWNITTSSDDDDDDNTGLTFIANTDENGAFTGSWSITIENFSGTELPGTGGMGTTWFYIIGAILVCGAVVVLVTRRRVNAKAA